MVKIVREQKIVFRIDRKSEIEELLSYADILKDELHVLEGSIFSEKLKDITGRVSLFLKANADKEYEGAQDYYMGYSDSLKIVMNQSQKTPLVAKNYGIIREKKEFRDNGLYFSYDIIIVSPQIDMLEFIGDSRQLAPWAAVDRPYKG